MKKKIANIAIVAVFLGFIGAFALLMPILPDAEFSPLENRYLQGLPSFSLEDLAAGDFTADFEKYTTDQFPFRDAWTTVKARCELLMGKKENNGVYYCGDDTIVPSFSAPSDEDIDRNIGYLNALTEYTDIPVYFGLIPNPVEIYSYLLPAYAPTDSQQAVIDRAYSESKAANIDLASILRSHAREYVYYRTDHHWTSLGAFYGYGALCGAFGFPTPSLDDYERETVSESYYGSTYSSSGFSWVAPDTMETFVPDDGTATVLDCSQDPPAEGPLYVKSYLEAKDKYAMFLGGNTSLRSIETGHDGPSLLLIRDSYSDSLAPFLLKNFSRIDLVDLRYYRDPLAQLITDNGYDDILVLYSVNTFSTDRNLFLLDPNTMSP